MNEHVEREATEMSIACTRRAGVSDLLTNRIIRVPPVLEIRMI
jgi:hypothetical protein